MKRLNPVRELERRTAAGEVAPIPAAGRWNGDRAGRAALAQLRLRARTPESGTVPRMLAEVRRVFVESAVCENPEALARMIPDDAFRTLLATQNDEDFDAEILRLGMSCGRLAPEEFFGCRTVGDLVANMERAEREGRPKPTPDDILRHNRKARRGARVTAIFVLVVVLLVLFRLSLLFNRIAGLFNP